MTRHALALALALAAGSAPAVALPTDTPPPLAYDLMVDSVTVLNVSVATHQFTSISGLSGGHFAVLQSTDAVNFCCSFEAGASTIPVAGTRGCIAGQKEPGGGFYWLAVKRWARDLTLRCQTFKTEAQGSTVLRVLQGR